MADTPQPDRSTAPAPRLLPGLDESTPPVPIDESACQRFEAAWFAGRRVAIEECLPQADHPLFLATLEELVIIETELAWKAYGPQGGARGQPRPPLVEEYLARFPALARPEVTGRLLRHEQRTRNRYAEPPGAEEYQRRFPELFATAAMVGTAASSFEDPHPIEGYEILGVLGRGGMGVVYKARQINANRLVALKMISPTEAESPGARDRFRTEAEAVARIQHPGIVQVFEVGEVNDRPFFSLEFCPGGTLARLMKERRFTPREAAELIEYLARAAAVAHASGVVHRDLKPSNILLQTPSELQEVKSETRTGDSLAELASPILEYQPKIADFGISKRLDATLGPTGTGALLGTPTYMSPEQAGGESKRVGPAADIWSLGVVLYELLSGQPPFTGGTTIEVLENVRTQTPASPRWRRPGVPFDLETICLKCLNKEPERRYATAAELADDLRRFLDHEPIRARRVGGFERALLWARRRPLVAGLLVLVVLVLVAGASVSTFFAFAAEHEAQNAKEKAHEAERNEAEARAREKEAIEARSELEKTLARSLLRPLGHRARTPVNPVEVDALRELLTLRNETVRRLFIEFALEKPETAWQLANRREAALIALFGLDGPRRRAFDESLRSRLQAAPDDRRLRQACVVLGLAVGSDVRTWVREAEAIAAQPYTNEENAGYKLALHAELGRVADSGDVEEIERAARLLVGEVIRGQTGALQLASAPSPFPRLVAALDGKRVNRLAEETAKPGPTRQALLYVALASRLEGDALTTAANRAMAALNQPNFEDRHDGVTALIALVPFLPPDDARKRSLAAVEGMLDHPIPPERLPDAARLLFGLLPRLASADRASQARRLANLISATWTERRVDPALGGRLLSLFGPVAEHLHPDDVATMAALLSDRLAKEKGDGWSALLPSYSEVASHLDKPRLLKETETYLAALGRKDGDLSRTVAQARVVLELARRLEPPVSVEKTSTAARLVVEVMTGPGSHYQLPVVLRDLVAGADDATAQAVAPAVARLVANPHTNYFASAGLVEAFEALAPRLSEREAAALIPELAAGLRLVEARNTQDGVRLLARPLAAATARLAAETRQRVRDEAAGDLRRQLASCNSPRIASDLRQALLSLGHPCPRTLLTQVVAPVRDEATAAAAAGGPYRDARVLASCCELAVGFEPADAAEVAVRLAPALRWYESLPFIRAYEQLLAALAPGDASRAAETCLRALMERHALECYSDLPPAAAFHRTLSASVVRFLTDRQIMSLLRSPVCLGEVREELISEFDLRARGKPELRGAPAAERERGRLFRDDAGLIRWTEANRPELLAPREP